MHHGQNMEAKQRKFRKKPTLNENRENL